MDPYSVPVYILRVPVRYYRYPPPTFRGWRSDAPPHWGDYWGRNWERRRDGWDAWDRRAAPSRRPPRCRPTSGSIHGTSIPGKWNGSTNSSRNATVTSRVTPSCASSMRIAISGTIAIRAWGRDQDRGRNHDRR